MLYGAWCLQRKTGLGPAQAVDEPGVSETHGGDVVPSGTGCQHGGLLPSEQLPTTRAAPGPPGSAAAAIAGAIVLELRGEVACCRGSPRLALNPR